MITSQVDIVQLVSSVSEDNRSAFNMLYQVYYDKVFCYAYHYVRDKQICREVVLDVFLAIWNSRRNLIDITNLDAYFYVVTKNEAVRYLNKEQKHEEISLDELAVELKEPEQVSPEEVLIDREIEILLSKVINQLPEKCRLIFLMARRDGLKPKEIGEILSINESTVRVQMKIAIEKIVTMIRPHFPNLTLTLLLSFLSRIH